MKWLSILVLFLILGCTNIPCQGHFGIYSLDLNTREVKLVYSNESSMSSLKLSSFGVFAFEMGEEIFTFNGALNQLTSNELLDTYPSWSSDGERIVYLSFNETMDLWLMNLDGSNKSLLYDSGFHDSDVDWVGDSIVFTRNSQIWLLDPLMQLTNYSRAGEWGQANLPFGDYDPRISPDGSRVVFERLIGDDSPHGNYDICVINIDGSGEHCFMSDYYSQGFATWSPSGQRLAYLVAAVNDTGVYRIYLMNPDGSGIELAREFPRGFLCHAPVFASEELIYFIGEWWS